jgi:hypothetical protein
MDDVVSEVSNDVLQKALSPEFWKELNPGMSVSVNLDIHDQNQFKLNPEDINLALTCLSVDGYFIADPVVPFDLYSRLADVIHRVVQEGFLPPFAMVYDEFWTLLWRFNYLLEPILGKNYQLLPDFWVWHVDNDGQSSGWSQHRDHEWPDRKVLRSDRRPTIMTIWIPNDNMDPFF